MFCSVNSNEENYKLDRFKACCVQLTRMKKITSLIDLNIYRSSSSSMSKTFQVPCPGQIAPESARDSYDAIYHATIMYLEFDQGYLKEEKICSGLSCEKLSSKACSHLTRNKNFPSKSAGQALITQQVKL